MTNTKPGTIVSALRSGITNAGREPASLLDPAFLKQMTLLHNSARGAMHEQIAQMAVIATFDTLEIQQTKYLNTPFGKRFVDLYLPEKNIAIEVKSGRICHSRLIRNQIKKDQWLLNTSDCVDRVIWMLFEGASPTVLASCERAGLEIIQELGS